jgi:hypothetical protein
MAGLVLNDAYKDSSSRLQSFDLAFFRDLVMSVNNSVSAKFPPNPRPRMLVMDSCLGNRTWMKIVPSQSDLISLFCALPPRLGKLSRIGTCKCSCCGIDGYNSLSFIKPLAFEEASKYACSSPRDRSQVLILHRAWFTQQSGLHCWIRLAILCLWLNGYTVSSVPYQHTERSRVKCRLPAPNLALNFRDAGSKISGSPNWLPLTARRPTAYRNTFLAAARWLHYDNDLLAIGAWRLSRIRQTRTGNSP